MIYYAFLVATSCHTPKKRRHTMKEAALDQFVHCFSVFFAQLLLVFGSKAWLRLVTKKHFRVDLAFTNFALGVRSDYGPYVVESVIDASLRICLDHSMYMLLIMYGCDTFLHRRRIHRLEGIV